MITSQSRGGFGVGPLKLWSLAATLAICLPALAVAEGSGIKIQVGKGDPVDASPDFTSTKIGITAAQSTETVELTASRTQDDKIVDFGNRLPRTLPNDKPTTITSESAPGAFEAHVWNFDQSNNKILGGCDKVTPNEDGKLVLDMAKFNCAGVRRQGTLIEVQAGTQYAYFIMNNRTMPQTGDDVGIALTLVDRWKGDDDDDGNEVREGARINNGVSFYYSVSNLKTDHVRLIGNVSLMDAAEDLDFEVGLGLGLLFKTRPLTGATAFGIAGGGGYNLMLNDSDKRWYTFVGFSMNFNQQGGDQ